MSALSYPTVLDALESILQNDARLEDMHVSQEPESPTTEQAGDGAVLIDLQRFDRSPTRMTAMLRSASPYNENVYIRLRCWVFDAQSTASARRRQATLVQQVMDVIADNPTLNSTVLYAGVHRGDFQTIPRDGGGIFACAELSVEALVSS